MNEYFINEPGPPADWKLTRSCRTCALGLQAVKGA